MQRKGRQLHACTQAAMLDGLGSKGGGMAGGEITVVHPTHLAEPLLDRSESERPALVVRERLGSHDARILAVPLALAHG